VEVILQFEDGSYGEFEDSFSDGLPEYLQNYFDNEFEYLLENFSKHVDVLVRSDPEDTKVLYYFVMN
jgi:hypothetical protein